VATILKHIQAIVLLPIMATIIIPAIVITITGSISIGWSLPFPVNFTVAVMGIFLIALGLTLVVKTIASFATFGQGTLAPWSPTQKLVIRGVYRYVRNPMISGVCCILLGEVMLLGSIPLLYWFLLFVVLNLIYIPLVEESRLERRFGEDYIAYKRHVPRWIPRFSPWDAASKRSR
jgi:protein-S-isoprenylcysteine O-methyltransferase Ste14